MSIFCTNSLFLYCLAIVSLDLLYISKAESFDYPTANLSTTWTNSHSLPHSVNFTDGSMVVWSANRNNPVSINSTLQLTSDGDLVLKDVDGTIAWSTNTRGKSVAGLNLTDTGNLVLFDNNKAIVWQSFGHPTDCLVPGQKLVSGQKLIPSVSTTNWTQLNLLSLSVTDEGFLAAVESNPPQVYEESRVYGNKTNKEPTYVTLRNGSFALFANSSEPSEPDIFIPIPEASSAQYVRFCPDGHFRLYEWGTNGWKEVADLLSAPGYECFYPTVCGNYGICSNGQCSCPSTTYFQQINNRQPNLGCSTITPLTCEASQNQSFLELKDTTYSSFRIDFKNVDSESCKMACSKNCSCKAAIFQVSLNSSIGDCYLPNQIFTLINNDIEKTHYNSIVYLKVQNLPLKAQNPPTAETIAPHQQKKSRVATILWSSLGAFFGLLLTIGVVVFLMWRKRHADEDEEDFLDQVPGMPTRFSYDDLKAITKNFSKLLGEGGFGSVFEGTLTDGTKIAVKSLHDLGQIKKSFLAEIESIGSIHHVNLVRLLGFCADKSHRLLVYEFISNGSLDKWIFHKTHDLFLDWKQRKKIILDIAKGLTYLWSCSVFLNICGGKDLKTNLIYPKMREVSTIWMRVSLPPGIAPTYGGFLHYALDLITL
ncbi:G-type lectin S-receptor-like serine/threonine-protein kinase SD2-5 [Jatropha curcas]|uniref:G-type lectin S-receptor-like serine/threonine-protein kinase SD2-5 n=1 Tax=Jatropha curcas TaxID=180498 RepID=UPI001893B416|nr:G-type lectin S-receptor-like serine/threonine-protein kinase SD2-5 [Jatropha curcas]